MTEQLDLLAYRPPSVPTDTSEVAAEQIRPSASTLRARVLTQLERGPQTDEELQRALSMNPSTERPRRGELVKAGLARDSGIRRPTLSKRAAIVWEAL